MEKEARALMMAAVVKMLFRGMDIRTLEITLLGLIIGEGQCDILYITKLKIKSNYSRSLSN